MKLFGLFFGLFVIFALFAALGSLGNLGPTEIKIFLGMVVLWFLFWLFTRSEKKV